jgi:hypothetical protein
LLCGLCRLQNQRQKRLQCLVTYMYVNGSLSCAVCMTSYILVDLWSSFWSIYISQQGQLMFCQSAMLELLASNGDLTGDCLSGLCSLFALSSWQPKRTWSFSLIYIVAVVILPFLYEQFKWIHHLLQVPRKSTVWIKANRSCLGKRSEIFPVRLQVKR